jgi:hypothetical protein
LGSAFLAQLELTRELQASNERDKVFGIMGFFNGLDKILPSPNYSKPKAAVSEVAMALIANSLSMDVLSSCCAGSRILDLPSWAPDWSFPNANRPSYKDFSAAKGSKATY